MALGSIEERSVVVGDGLSMYFRVYRAPIPGRTPLLCLPGYWRNCRDYEDLAPYVATSRDVITPDLRGRGRTSYASSSAQYAFDLLVDDVWQLLDTLEIHRTVVLGTTLGGLIALEMAAQMPRRIAGIVLNDVGPEKSVTSSKRMATFAGSQEYSFDDAVARVKAQNEAFFPSFGADDWKRMMLRAYRPTASGHYTRDFDQLTNEATAELFRSRPTFWKEFNSARSIPLAVLRGEFSDYLSEEVVARMKQEVPHLLATTVSGRGHPPQLDEPEARSTLDALLARVDETG